jgi:DNA-directed RNA polymerase specialized sigma24 family protein
VSTPTDTDARAIERFAAFDAMARPRLQRALVARYGVDVGVEAAADALAYGWEHWVRVEAMANPVGYLYRVGQTAARRHRRRPVRLPAEEPTRLGDPEPGLRVALTKLTEDQRAAVLLVHAYGWSYAEAAQVLDIPVSSLRNHLHRGMARLRRHLEP